MDEIVADSEKQVIDAVRVARETRAPFEIVAGGTRRGFGRPSSATVLDVSGLKGILNYEPEELILTAAPGTPLVEIEQALSAKAQRLGFDPADWSSLLGMSGIATLGGAISADASGAARVRYGAARDQLLGFHAVNGLAESFKAGGRVVKNVTGFDISKLVCGAMGTLCVLTEVTLRVFPKPHGAATLAVDDVVPPEGLALLRLVWSSALEPTGLAYLPASAGLGARGRGTALFRLEGAAAPLKEKAALLAKLLKPHAARVLDDGDAIFRKLGAGIPFVETSLDVWRVAMPPSEAARFAEAVASPLWYADWAGGLLWIGTAPGDAEAAQALRALAAKAGGHATLLCADGDTRARGAFQPQDAQHLALTRAVKAAFDPLSLFNPGRMYENV